MLYTPVVHAEDFDAAVSYLVRRLEENAGHENYLYAMFSADGPASYVDRFRASVRDRDTVADTPRRTQDRSAERVRNLAGIQQRHIPCTRRQDGAVHPRRGRVPQRARHRPRAARQPRLGPARGSRRARTSSGSPS